MSRFVVAGITQMETIVEVDSLPIEYSPLSIVPDSIFSAPGGDALNEAMALRWLGDDVDFLSVVGRSQDLGVFNPPKREVTINTDYILPLMELTPQQVVLYQDDSHRQVFEDLKGVRDVTYDMEIARPLMDSTDWVVLANANFCRPFISLAHEEKKPVAVRIHNFSREKEHYNADYLSSASVLYFSGSMLDEDPYAFVKGMADTYQNDIILLGMGMDMDGGVLLYDREQNTSVRYKTVKTVKVVNTTGAGNALFSCFLHYYAITKDPIYSIHNALLFTSYKVGYDGTSNGFMTIRQLEQWRNLIWK